MLGEELKCCSKCGEYKPIDEFGRGNKGKPRPECKVCLARIQREYYAKKQPLLIVRRRIKSLERFAQAHNIALKIEIGQTED